MDKYRNKEGKEKPKGKIKIKGEKDDGGRER